MDYECRLEQAFREGPTLCGVCQYHINTLPDDANPKRFLDLDGLDGRVEKALDKVISHEQAEL